jgi:SAM-dependent methyltransferase
VRRGSHSHKTAERKAKDVTTEEAKELIGGAVRDGERPVGPRWADLGSGSGTFTFALSELLGPDGEVVAVDREAAPLESLRRGLEARGVAAGRVVAAVGDFRDPSAVPELAGRFDGVLFANALHFDPEPARTLGRITDRLAPGGRVVVVEYEDRPPNPWVPHPLPSEGLREVAEAAGLGSPRVVAERPSTYGGVLYCAWLGV